MKRVTLPVLLVLSFVALGGCKLLSKGDSGDASATATPTPVASVSGAVASASVAAATPAAPVAPPAGAQPAGVVADPNVAPVRATDDSTAKAEISKANYKSEMDKLEKEDLTQDTK